MEKNSAENIIDANNEIVYPATDIFRDKGKAVGAMEKNKQFPVLLPPEDIFRKYETVADATIEEIKDFNKQQAPVTIGIEYPSDGGQMLWYFHNKYGKWGHPFKEAVIAANIIKRSSINVVRFLGSSPVRYGVLLFVFLPRFLKRKVIASAIQYYGNFCERTIAYLCSNWGFEPKFYCPMVREIYRVGILLSGDSIPGKEVTEGISEVLEYDDAYRYIAQDFFENLNKEDFYKNPSKEVMRLFTLCSSRVQGGPTGEMKARMYKMGRFISLILTLKDIKEVAIRFVKELDIQKVSFDDRDLYQVSLWYGYNFRGMSIEKRTAIRKKIDEDPSIPFIEERMQGLKENEVNNINA